MSDKKQVTVFLDTTPLQNANSNRGVGAYTRFLGQHLENIEYIKLVTEKKPGIIPDLDLVHYPFFDLFFPTLPLVKQKPTIVTIHDVIPLRFRDQYKPGLKGKFSFWRQALSLRSVSAVITDSDASKNDISHFFPTLKDKVKTVPLAGNPELNPQSQQLVANAREKYSLPDKYVLYVGDINYNKNIPQLIKMMKFLPDDIHLVCVGQNFIPQPIPEWDAIQRQLTLSQVEDKITFLTDVPKSEPNVLAALYSGAEVYVQPSLYEGFGLPVLEAMQCRTPVVSTNNSSLAEVGGNHVVYASSEQAVDLADAAKTVLEWTKTKRSEWIKAAETWANHYSWKKTATETAQVYQEVFAQAKPR